MGLSSELQLNSVDEFSCQQLVHFGSPRAFLLAWLHEAGSAVSRLPHARGTTPNIFWGLWDCLTWTVDCV